MRLLIAIRCYLLGLLLCIASTAIPRVEAQTEKTVTIQGYVLDRAKEPIPLATIQVEGKSLGTTANLKGHYTLRLKAQPDSLTIVFSSLGYHKSKRTLPSLLGDLRLNVELGEDAQTLGDVEVNATAQAPKSPLQRLSTDKLVIGGSASGGIEAVVGTMAGVAQKNELSSQYTVRGGNFDENLVYINGVEIYRPLLARSAEQEGLSAINPDLTESLLFSAGGFGADYGDKTSSVLDIKYKRPDSLEGAAYLSLLESRIYVGSRHGKLSQITGLRYKRGNSLLSTLDTEAEYHPLYTDAQTAIHYRPSNHWTLSLLGYLSHTDYNFTPRSRHTTFGTLANAKQLNISFDGGEQDRFTSQLLSTTISYVPSDRSRYSASLAYFSSQEQERYDIAGEYILSDAADNIGSVGAEPVPFENETKALGIGRYRSHGRNRLTYDLWTASLRGQWQWRTGHRLLGGIDIRGESIRDGIAEWELRDSVGYTTPLSSSLLQAHRNLYGQTTTSSLRLSSFVENRSQHSLDNLGDLAVNLGLRSSWWSWTGELILSPRLSLLFTPKGRKELGLRLASGIYHQAPFYREFRTEQADKEGNGFVVLNRNIRSQSTWLLLLGAEYDFDISGRKFKFSAESYYKYLWHLNPYVQENIKLKYLGENVATGYVWGLDGKLYGEFVEGVDSWLSLSLLHARQSVRGRTAVALPNAPSLNASLFFQDYFPGFKPIRLTLRAQYSSGLPIALPSAPFEVQSFISSPYRRVDIGVVYRLTQRGNGSNQRWWRSRYAKAIDVGIDVLNLFDMSNTSSYYWVTDAYNHSYAIPNYLTRRAWNVSIKVSF